MDILQMLIFILKQVLGFRQIVRFFDLFLRSHFLMHSGELFHAQFRFGEDGFQLGGERHRFFIEREHFGQRHIALLQPIDDGGEALEFGFEAGGWFLFTWHSSYCGSDTS